MEIKRLIIRLLYKLGWRRDESVIPKNTPYCYTLLGGFDENDHLPIKCCPYWNKRGCYYNGMKADFVFEDQVKCCGINRSF